MIEKEFRFELDIKANSRIKWSDMTDERKHKTDLEISITTPDTRTHSKYLARDKLAKVLGIHLKCIERDELVWAVNRP